MSNAKIIQAAARYLSVSEASIRRILSSVYVIVGDPSPPPEAESVAGDPEEGVKRFNIGLRMGADLPKESLLQVEQRLNQILQEYRTTCPKVFEWMLRGDFDPKKLPDTVNLAALLHASRTAGRLRAKLTRP